MDCDMTGITHVLKSTKSYIVECHLYIWCIYFIIFLSTTAVMSSVFYSQTINE